MARAFFSAAAMALKLMRLASQGLSLGTSRPLKPKAKEIWATLTPLTSRIRGLSLSSSVRADPVCLRPSRSRVSRVRKTPSGPWSRVWFEAVEQVSYPTFLIVLAICGGTRKSG